MASPERCRMLDGLWQQASSDAGSTAVLEFATCPLATTTTLSDCPVVVVTMPPPRAAGEAHFVGLVLTGLPARGEPAHNVTVRCFTIEQGAGAQHATLCEWLDDERVELEATTTATAAGFLAAIERRLG
jgi:hypothetical protein